MGFESLRGYFQLASGLGELTRARAMEAAQGMLSLPGVGNATGKVAGQVSALAEELLAAALTNREHLTALVRSEVDVAVTRLGLVTADKLAASQAETARLRAEVAELRSTSTPSTAKRTATTKRTAPKKTAAKKSAAEKTAAKKTAAKKTAATRPALKKASAATVASTSVETAKTANAQARATPVRRSAVTTRRNPDGS